MRLGRGTTAAGKPGSFVWAAAVHVGFAIVGGASGADSLSLSVVGRRVGVRKLRAMLSGKCDQEGGCLALARGAILVKIVNNCQSRL